ncbi:hypothetical protein CO058_01155 [candidate division WWE3 bacterium CG_4_9_14_0_2_um_filter_35_11]|uniref:Uncharacterized protein n=1 Tax=candidate division WWE3 bacterium CG_4_9_14_0_2_um_filter_35_11 TaxID=1975077 RepID=A0A2M8EM95_UNCKA|nr:MAG: hypothetical protein COV25_02975 [candidate division WWE3 bacterium CG10_big_fil_rev_8_21_14_0_10_35_32]PJC23848.1 MAG: hypothetical protein CO058_01155 [candidate division WWE3 bacterium CG_4_9_14_0_2_um_filter_35_11]
MTDEAVLIHGWDPNYYNSNLGKEVPKGEAWSHRQELIDLLGQNFELSYFNLLGFVNIEEPERSFNVEDFTDNFAVWVEKG